MPDREEREAMVAGDRGGALNPAEAADVDLLAGVLADPATWAEPPAGLEDVIVRAVSDAQSEATVSVTPVVPLRPQRRRYVLSAVAAAAVIALVLAVTFARGGSGADFKGQLSATALAPGAHASVAITRNNAGFRVTLDASGLPRLTGDHFYQAWLKNAAGTLVPIGTFSSSDGPVTLWSGVSPAQFPTITVTMEAADGNQASSGKRVLVGRVTPG